MFHVEHCIESVASRCKRTGFCSTQCSTWNIVLVLIWAHPCWQKGYQWMKMKRASRVATLLARLFGSVLRTSAAHRLTIRSACAGNIKRDAHPPSILSFSATNARN